MSERNPRRSETVEGNDRLEAMGEQLGFAKDECAEALVRLARVATDGDQCTLDAMEGLALAVDRLTAVRAVLKQPRWSPAEAVAS